MLVTYFAFLSLLFVMFRVMPGDPTSRYIISGMNDEQAAAIRERLGLDAPLHEQYIDYIFNAVQLDFGESYMYNQAVSDVLYIKLMNTIFLMGGALILAYLIAVIFGSLIGWYRDTNYERFGMVIALISRSSPSFFIGIILLVIFVFTFELFPSGGMRSVGEVGVTEADLGKYLNWDFVHHLILPMLTGAIVWMATPMLLMRNSMIEILDEDFIEIKKAEGLPEYVVLYKHAVRNSVLPLITVAAVSVGYALGGSVVIESVFNWPGMGQVMVEALNSRDYPLAQATFFLMGSIVIFMNFVADMLYMYLDPRVVYE
jgi:peptide/nickel transport system permease protein